MAEHAMIDRYLSELEREVRWFRDAEEILEEVADHLLEAVAVHTRHGLDRIAAQKRAQHVLILRAFATAPQSLWASSTGATLPTAPGLGKGYHWRCT